MHSASSPSREPLPMVSFPRVLLWLVIVPLILLTSCVAGSIALTLLQWIAPNLNPFVSISLPERLLFSFIMGLTTAVLLNHLWNPYVRTTNWHWVAINMLAISSGIMLTTWPIFRIGYCITFPLGWLGPAIGVGIGLGTVQWVYLQRQIRQAGWWIPVLACGWIVVWFVVVVSGCVLNDH